MDNEKHMLINPITVIQIANILNYLIENNKYSAQIGEITITYIGEKADTINGTRQFFEIQRKVD